MLLVRELQPSLQRLDNEVSAALIAYLDQEQVTFQLTPAGIHRKNSAKHAIRTWEIHFLTLLSGTDPIFPMKL